MHYTRILKQLYGINLTYCPFNLCRVFTLCPSGVLPMSHQYLLDVTPVCFHFQKLSPTPQQTQGGSISSPHPSQPSQEESSPCSDMSSYEEPPSPLSAASSGPPAPAPAPAQVPVHRHPSRASDHEGCAGRDAPSLCQRFLPNDPTRWNVEEVYEFIRSLPGEWSKHRPLIMRHTHVLLMNAVLKCD